MNSKLIDEIKHLEDQKYELLENIKTIDEKINSIKQKIYNDCIIKNNGHEIYCEKEPGPYGENFYYCKNCGCSL